MIPYMVGKLAPNSSYLTRRLVKYVSGRGSFRTVPSQNGDKIVTSPPPPQSLNVHFLFRCVAHSLSLLSLSSYNIWVFLHCLYGCLSCPTRIICGCPLFISLLFVFCFLVFPPESLPGDDVLRGLRSRPLPSVCVLPCLFVSFCFSLTVFVPGLLWCNFLYLVTTAGFIRSGPVNNVR